MHLRTHLAVGVALALYFLPHVNDKLIFFPSVLVASILPNLGSLFTHGRKDYRRKGIFSFLMKEKDTRGIIHTYTVCILVALALAFFYPVFALPFFLGYSFHLFLDSFTTEGITPFWPYKKKSTGHVKSGGKIDKVIFYLVIVFCIALFVKLMM